jgi:hypothetical protein
MRKMIAVATLGLVLGVAGAAGPADDSAEGRAYLGFSFGGDKIAPHDFHYGLRMDYDSRSIESRGFGTPALLQFDFTHRGLNAAQVNGLSILKKSYQLKQNEGQPTETPPAEGQPAEAAPAESAPAESPPPEAASGGEAAAAAEPAAEEGFFAGMWHGVKNFFGGMFGSDEETETAAKEGKEAGESAPAAEGPTPEEGELAEGTFMGYNAIDWATLAVGAVGIGFVASEVSNGSQDPDPRASGGTGGTGGGLTPAPCTTGITPVPCVGLRSGKAFSAFDVEAQDPEYQKWLDGGTGQMGDLGG